MTSQWVGWRLEINHQPHDCLLNCLSGRRSKKTSKPRVTGLCAENSPETGEFPAQMSSNAETVSIWWRHHDNTQNNEHDSRFVVCIEIRQWPILPLSNRVISLALEQLYNFVSSVEAILKNMGKQITWRHPKYKLKTKRKKNKHHAHTVWDTWIVLGIDSAGERWRYYVTPPLTGRANAQNDSWDILYTMNNIVAADCLAKFCANGLTSLRPSDGYMRQ